jgi:hypothetical protein
VTPALTEKNHFPGLREFAVTLPLTLEAEDNSTPQTPATTRPAPGSKFIEDSEAAGRQPETESPASESFDLRWLFLLLIPSFVLLLRFWRSPKAS